MGKFIVVQGIRIAKDFVPETFGRLTTIGPKFLLRASSRVRQFQVCQCTCGNLTVANNYDLRSGHTKSCGCVAREKASISCKNRKIHGMTRSIEMSSYRSMKHRCRCVNATGYCNYGGRGIVICDRWLEPKGRGFLNFVADMGPRPSLKHEIERKDVDGNYCPENCRWATPDEQARNTRANVNITYNGKTQCVTAWAEEIGISASTLFTRLRKGKTAEKVLSISVDSAKNKANKPMLTHNGKTQSIYDWAIETGIHIATIKDRIKRGWSVSDALTLPVQSEYKRKHAT